MDGNISVNSTIVDAQKQEVHTEDVLNLKLDLECWTWSRNKAPPQKVHHPQEGLGTSPSLYTNALGFDQIRYNFKTGVQDVFKSFNYSIYLCWPKVCPKIKPGLFDNHIHVKIKGDLRLIRGSPDGNRPSPYELLHYSKSTDLQSTNLYFWENNVYIFGVFEDFYCVCMG